MAMASVSSGWAAEASAEAVRGLRATGKERAIDACLAKIGEICEFWGQYGLLSRRWL